MSSTKKGKGTRGRPRTRSDAKRAKDAANWKTGAAARTVRWAMDYDYIERLSAQDKEWLRRFTREYYDGSVERGGSKGVPRAIHRTTRLRRDCYNRKNLANRDLFSILNANGKIDRLPEAPPDSAKPDDTDE